VPKADRPRPRPLASRPARIRFAILVILVVTLVVGTLIIGPDRHNLVQAASMTGPAAAAIAVAGSALLAVAVVPRTLLALVAGALYGWLPGTMYSLIGVTLGASIAFVIGRTLGREFIRARLHDRLATLERMLSRWGLLAVAIARLIPLVPFGISNYAFGVTSVPVARFALGTLLGAFPATAAYAVLGSATTHGEPRLAAAAGVVVIGLGIGGSIGSCLLGRNQLVGLARRVPRMASRLRRQDQPAAPTGLEGSTDGGPTAGIHG